ncbi:hypothetical protein SAMN06272775_5993 [Streptomyces sp. 2323.1]|uniref:hypothetical protein n=1 Tax=Streptomyces sp. 2323.1 TaxID=1938841 RepID=UPI000BC0B4BF|nr:hypothetical protein [Streptomyces sp. 2323.1]SOE15063.1 hypothetical protein SAMN06272775_5993 [Streptomyces sp. 2323.1]
MPKYWSKRALSEQTPQDDAPLIDARQQRLACLLAEMVPGASILRVSQRQPGQSWPSPYARAYDGRGAPIALNRAQRTTLARWVIRAHPELIWGEAYDLSLTTGSLRPAAEACAATGKEC